MPLSSQARAKERGRSPGWLSRMHRNNSPSQRSASPATTRESSPRVQSRHYPPHVDGAVSSRTDTPERDISPVVPPMPAFLNLSHSGKIMPALNALALILIEFKRYMRDSWNLFASRENE